MLTWFTHRLAEPSTRLGGLVVAAAVTHVLTTPPATGADWLAALFAVAGGLLGVATSEGNKSP